MKVKIANKKTEEPCPNCGTVTPERYVIDKPGRNEIVTCGQCVESVITSFNDGLYGLHEWNQEDHPTLEQHELVQVIETEFIRSGRPIRHDTGLFRYHQEHLDMAEDLVPEKLEKTVTGVDDGRAFRPAPERRLQLIQIHNLFSKWDVGSKRIEVIKNEIRDSLDRKVRFPQ